VVATRAGRRRPRGGPCSRTRPDGTGSSSPTKSRPVISLSGSKTDRRSDEKTRERDQRGNAPRSSGERWSISWLDPMGTGNLEPSRAHNTQQLGFLRDGVEHDACRQDDDVPFRVHAQSANRSAIAKL